MNSPSYDSQNSKMAGSSQKRDRPSSSKLHDFELFDDSDSDYGQLSDPEDPEFLPEPKKQRFVVPVEAKGAKKGATKVNKGKGKALKPTRSRSTNVPRNMDSF